MGRALIVIVAIMSVALLSAIKVAVYRGNEIDRINSNIDIIYQETETYKDKLSREIQRNGVQVLRISELERYNAELSKSIEALNINKRKITEIAQSQLTVRIDTILKEKLIFVRSDTAKLYGFNDGYNSVECVVSGDSAVIRIEVKDSINVVCHTRRDKVLGLRIGKKRLYSDHYSVNKRANVDVNILYIR